MWSLPLLCLVDGLVGMNRYRKDGVEKEALWLTEGRQVWVRGVVRETGGKGKSYGLMLPGCRETGTETWTEGESDGNEFVGSGK